MTAFFSIILPIFLTICVFGLPKLREWLEFKASDSHVRTALIEEFHTEAMKFMKETDSQDNELLRRFVWRAADKMIDGSKLIRTVIFASNGANGKRSQTTLDAQKALKALEAGPRKSFSNVLALSLMVSSTQSLFFGGLYRSVITLAISEKERTAREPETLVKRFNKLAFLQKPDQKQVC
ncbi:hypothetical protein KL867_17790 [Ruegeria litorea]|uniref:Uncharacterized protein n=1 Tax=Falsiruegeria litorea TaxID=1280831 RepID=A0ABS5WUV0_9RHOB|nr:hypothetical protein [Falsiruegeria litorea]MBT3142925.1 hypothetical protein [Falsiruegeria litorea]